MQCQLLGIKDDYRTNEVTMKATYQIRGEVQQSNWKIGEVL